MSPHTNQWMNTIYDIAIGNPVGSQSMGDTLLLTAVCKHQRNLIVELHPKAEQYDFFFKGICKEVKIVEKPTLCPEKGGGLYVDRKLAAMGHAGADNLPHVSRQAYFDFLEEAKEELRDYHNPIVFAPNTSPKGIPKAQFEMEFWKPILQELSKTYSVLQFGCSSNFSDFDDVAGQFIDYPLEKVAAMFSLIRKYVGVDTGIHHLMLAVGGDNVIYHHNRGLKEQFESGHMFHEWNYDSPRVSYVNADSKFKILKEL